MLLNNKINLKQVFRKIFWGSKALYIFIGVSLLFASCISYKIPHYTYNKKLPAEKVKEDIVLLKKILEANHPSLYWFTPKDSLDYFFESAYQNLPDSLNEIQVKNKVASIVSKIRCGHTSVRFSQDFSTHTQQHQYPMFPLFLKAWDDSLVVLANAFEKDTIFKRGTIITSINGKNNRAILDSIFQFISTDGYSENYKNQSVSLNFPAWYKTCIGLDSVYTITYIDSSGKEAVTTIKNFTPIIDTTLKKENLKKATTLAKPTRKERRQSRILSKRSMQIDTSINTAYIKLNTFSNARLRSFFKNSLQIIQEKNIENVVIDLRQNGGGSMAITKRFLQYFADKPFKFADTVAAISRTFPHRKYIKEWGLYWFPMNFLAHKEADNLIHFRRFEQHYFKPKSKYHFNGNLFLIQGGYTFSAATMFISTLQGQSNVTVVGEETGGGFYGNSAVHIPTIVLPNSKLRISLPMYRMVMNKNRPKGRGIIPDIVIPPSSNAIKEGVDTKLVTIRNIILEKKTTN